MGDPGRLPADDPELEPQAASPDGNGLTRVGYAQVGPAEDVDELERAGRGNRIGQRRKGGHAEHLAFPGVDRHTVVAVVDQRPEDAVRRPVRIGRGADDRDPPGGAQDAFDAGVVEDGDGARALLEVEEGRGSIALVARQVAASRSYGCPSAAGGMLRPTTPARMMIVTR